MKTLPLIKSDPWLEPYSDAIYGRYEYAQYMEKKLTKGTQSLANFASGYMYFGLHKTTDGWAFREWAPNATAIYLVGDFNGWKKDNGYALTKLQEGIWEIRLPEYSMTHGQHYKLYIEWEGGSGERVPAWATRVVQDPVTYIFSAQVWDPLNHYVFKNKNFAPSKDPLLIYECHIGMSSNEEKVSTYEEFRKNVLPRIKKGGYNCIQIMAIQEHPYYGSFGYHVSSFFAASSRFGTPEELKRLIDDAHGMGLTVIMDLVHSHAVKNEVEGLGRFDGTPYQYFHGGGRREHPAWDSLLFDYGKTQVIHFLLSNCKFWLEEYHFDGFRFDGVTSMLYKSHGLEEDFTSYDSYYNMNQDGDAICYLTLANKMIHEMRPDAITIAEEMSGMPGIAVKVADGGMGFDYRLAMGIPDFWIKYIKEVKAENWKVGHMFWELTNRRIEEKTISYAESHDQAMVGDKTIIFRLIDSDMYWHMQKGDTTLLVDRGVALNKMIRLITSTTMNGGYLNFMGNEFGHPEWIDFPRAGNGWSHKYARRQWELVDNENYLYHDLGEFDKAMLELIKSVDKFNLTPVYQIWNREPEQVLAYQREKLIFVFNFSETNSYTDYGILTEPGAYKVILNTDNPAFGGFGMIDEKVIHFTVTTPKHPIGKEWLQLYLPARTAMVLQRQG
ncbi:alpha amylase C-terminal domain-containing protein [Paludibacteraceae bacterium OttesenSCG-928-F17]|nr:alpha amylase C-terminal domain-containing protein [Paludibacteraceae bacterium OttesenSCG-928-F17]